MSIADKIELLERATAPAGVCFADLRLGHIIDLVENGRTRIYGKTLDEVRSQPGYADAEEMTVDAFVEWKAQQQATPTRWEPTTEDRFLEMLNVMPPIGWSSKGFLVGEPWDHCAKTGAPRYQAFRQIGSDFFVSSRPMTLREFREAVS